MSKIILGISAFYHDSAAAILVDGKLVAAAQEERFTRKKHDESFPKHACEYVLKAAGCLPEQIDTVVFYEKPYLKFERLLETYHAMAPKGIKSFIKSMPLWIKEKLFMRKTIKDELKALGINKFNLLFSDHHLSHLASAFYPSPFEEAAMLTLDGVGEWTTLSMAHGKGNEITLLRENHFPHSLGLLYSAFTYYCGFRVNSGEYKLMGLAPYGDPDSTQTKTFKSLIYDQLIDVREDGSFLLNMKYFDFATGLRMCNHRKWELLFGLTKREEESEEFSQDYMNLALAIQQVTEEIVLKIAKTAQSLTKSKNLVLAGGVALNCVANGKLQQSGLFKQIWIQPAAGDAGGALGAAYAAWHIHAGNKRLVQKNKDAMQGAYLGPEFSDKEIEDMAYFKGARYSKLKEKELCRRVSKLILQGQVVGWFQGRMEFGPRALGNRSILANPADPEMQKRLNLKIKFREGFRPFAPSVLEEDAKELFELSCDSPYMLLVAAVKKKLQLTLPKNYSELPLYERLYIKRSTYPAITHVDYSARVQTVSKQSNPRYYALLKEIKKETGIGCLVNTSFNIRGEPIVCTPDDAYRCFMGTEMDYLVLGDYLFCKVDQPEPKDDYASEYAKVLD